MALFFRRIIPLFAVAIMALNPGTASADLKDSVHPSGEIWARYDFMDNYDFDKATKDKLETIFPRTRLALDFGFKRIGGRVQVQDFRRFGDPLKSFIDESDTEIREAYLDLTGVRKRLTTIGRRRYDGKGRLWGNGWHWIGAPMTR